MWSLKAKIQPGPNPIFVCRQALVTELHGVACVSRSRLWERFGCRALLGSTGTTPWGGREARGGKREKGTSRSCQRASAEPTGSSVQAPVRESRQFPGRGEKSSPVSHSLPQSCCRGKEHLRPEEDQSQVRWLQCVPLYLCHYQTMSPQLPATSRPSKASLWGWECLDVKLLINYPKGKGP